MLQIIRSAVGLVIIGLALGFICGKKTYSTPDAHEENAAATVFLSTLC